MIPLWTKAQLSFINGWQFFIEGLPWVAHLVWAITTFTFNLLFLTDFCKYSAYIIESINDWVTNKKRKINKVIENDYRVIDLFQEEIRIKKLQSQRIKK